MIRAAAIAGKSPAKVRNGEECDFIFERNTLSISDSNQGVVERSDRRADLRQHHSLVFEHVAVMRIAH